VKAEFWASFEVGDAEPGDQAVAVARRQAAAFTATGKARYPAAVTCVTNDLASLTVHLRFPAEHWHRIRPPTSSSGPLGRAAAGPRSSVGSPARPAAWA
jgi:hypothetical protein